MGKAILYMLSAAAVLGMGGCGKANQPTSADNGGTEARTAEVSVELSVSAGSMVENTPTGTGLKAMEDYINENDGGTSKATDYYDIALGDATSMMQGLQQGAIDIGVFDTAYFSGLVPEVEVFQLPFLFDSLEEVRAAVDGAASEKTSEKLAERGIVGLASWENGFRELSNNVRPVTTPAGLSGIKTRTLSATVRVETWKALGALPTTIDTSKLYTALQQGTVSAEENPLHGVVSREFYETQQYVTLTGHVYTPFMMGTGQRTWDELNDQQKSVVVDVANASKETQRKANEGRTTGAKQTLLDSGRETVKSPDKEASKKIAVSAWKVSTDENDTELLDITQKNQRGRYRI